MTRIVFSLCLIIFSACATKVSRVDHSAVTLADEAAVAVELGDLSSSSTWVYLSGLTNDFDGVQVKAHLDMLEQIGVNNHIKIIAVKPIHRCPQFGDRLCWSNPDYTARKKLFDYLHEVIGTSTPAGYIGFSNGASFLINVAGMERLSGPVIAIGAAGHYEQAPFNNHVHLVVGQNDLHYYKPAVDFYERMKVQKLNVTLHEHIGGHEFPALKIDDIIEVIREPSQDGVPQVYMLETST